MAGGIHAALRQDADVIVIGDLRDSLAVDRAIRAAESGCLVLARLHGDPAGCVAFYAHDAITVEIKRMFVPARARGHRIGDQMMGLLLARARAAGYRRAPLSSHHSMHAAHAIYHRAGFRDVPPSAAFPGVVAGVDVCMAMALTADTSP